MPYGTRKDLRAAQAGMKKETQLVGEIINTEFKQAIDGVFGLDSVLDIGPGKRINDALPLVTALGAGFDYFHSMGKNNQAQEQEARVFLEAMGFVNRGEQKYAGKFVEAVGIMAGYAMIKAKNDFDAEFTMAREKIEKNGWQGLGVVYRGAVRQFLGYDTVRSLLTRLDNRWQHIVAVSEALTKKAQP